MAHKRYTHNKQHMLAREARASHSANAVTHASCRARAALAASAAHWQVVITRHCWHTTRQHYTRRRRHATRSNDITHSAVAVGAHTLLRCAYFCHIHTVMPPHTATLPHTATHTHTHRHTHTSILATHTHTHTHQQLWPWPRHTHTKDMAHVPNTQHTTHKQAIRPSNNTHRL